MDSFSIRNLKGFASDAATALTRAVQYTEERLGTAGRTELDAHFESLAQRADDTKLWTERLLSKAEAVLEPNPNVRVEDYLFDKLEKKRERPNNLEALGQDMVNAGGAFGAGTPYGSALIKVGQAEKNLGGAERDFGRSVHTHFLQPLRRFLEGDMKTIIKERRILENKRLDLDAAKNRLRKARSADPQANAQQIEKEIYQAEKEVELCQAEFDKQAEITRLLLEGISTTHANHVRCLSDFVEAQMALYAQCQRHMLDLQRELRALNMNVGCGGVNGEQAEAGGRVCAFQNVFEGQSGQAGQMGTHGSGQGPLRSTTGTERSNNNSSYRKAKVLYAYEALAGTELTVKQNEVLDVIDGPADLDPDFVVVRRVGSREWGKVPLAYLEILDDRINEKTTA
ncbi:endophilin-B1-like isoform X2 [Varroa destructor]|uniref:Endophilin-B1 n=1 Tax=Varroa destructor TaxID=109461 RepID=A0A7M7MDH5_VARDE|nr:endophilin-B1-like isoform X2 [Varroa destructor]